MKFLDGGMRTISIHGRDPGSGEAILCGHGDWGGGPVRLMCNISLHQRPKRWPIGLCIGLAIIFNAIFVPAVAQAITIW